MMNTIKKYRAARKQFEENHPEGNSWRGLLGILKDEFLELLDELQDVIMCIGLIVHKVTGTYVVCYIAWGTVKKRVGNFDNHGCVRSERNSCGKCRK